MEKTRPIASHDGTVLSSADGKVKVHIQSISACATCAAHAKCGFAESKEKNLEIPSADWQTFTEGEPVTVYIDESRGMLAVWIAYVLPAILMIATIVGFSLAHMPEWIVVFSAFAVLGLYILILYLRRRKVESHFTLTVTKH